MTRLLIAFVLLAWAVSADAQTVKNPRRAFFTCPDHAQDTGHELDIIDAKGVVVQTLQLGDPPLNTAGEVEVVINVQPIAFGTYTMVVRATDGALKSDNSAPTDPWQRVPGAPGKPKVGG